MPSITIQGMSTHYREWGSGDLTVLVLHGWPADSSHYEDLGPLLAKQGLRVIVPDLPGWGESQPPSAAWTVNDFKRFVHDFTQALQLKDYVLFGHSFGGRVAIKYVLEYAYEVRALVLCAAAGIRPDPYTLKRRVLKGLATTGKHLFALPGVKSLAPSARRVLYKAAGSTDYLKAEGVMKETIVKVLEEDLSALLPEIKRPTLLIWGSQDGATPLSQGQQMLRQIPAAKLVVFDGLRHNLPKLAPDKVAQAVATFVRSDEVTYIE